MGDPRVKGYARTDLIHHVRHTCHISQALRVVADGVVTKISHGMMSFVASYVAWESWVIPQNVFGPRRWRVLNLALLKGHVWCGRYYARLITQQHKLSVSLSLARVYVCVCVS